MNLDMHYHGTYVLAKLAGLKDDICKIIATSSQYVDDNAANLNLEFSDGALVKAQPSAHHVGQIIANLNVDDQRRVWVPFHFLPGNEGGSFEERIICRKDSILVNEVVQTHLKCQMKELLPYLIGITAHVYADTFAHYGFSGMSSEVNSVDNKSIKFYGLDSNTEEYITEKSEKFYKNERYGLHMDNLLSPFGEVLSASLGHASVATHPDRPYLEWSYEYTKDKVSVHRNNLNDYLEGSKKLFDMFISLGNIVPDFRENQDILDFSAYEDKIKLILSSEENQDGRIDKWVNKAKSGYFGGDGFEIPEYDTKTWEDTFNNSTEKDNSNNALTYDLLKFYKSISMHRYYVLNELLPKYNLFVY